MGKEYGKFKYSIGDYIQTNGRNLQIIDREYRPTKVKAKLKKGYCIQNKKYYKYRCVKCGNEDWMHEANLQIYGCNVCCQSPQKIKIGTNDVATTEPLIIPFFKNKEDSHLYTRGSNRKTYFVCPHCNKEHYLQVSYVVRMGYVPCPCSGNMSYPNKFMYAVLLQLGVDFQTEKSFEWSNGKLYDDYIEYDGLKIIVENHGLQHYEKQIHKNRTVEEEKFNDEYKLRLAKENGIDYYFAIDCRCSNMEHIKNSISTSGLLNVLGVSSSDIDWQKCAEFATSNFVKTVCEYQKEHPELMQHEIADKFHIHRKTVVRYMKQGVKLGWCNFDDNVKKEHNKQVIAPKKKPLYCPTVDRYYSSASDAEKDLSTEDFSLSPRNIRNSAQISRTYKGYDFCFITQEEFNKVKSKSPSKVVGDFFNIKPQNKEDSDYDQELSGAC